MLTRSIDRFALFLPVVLLLALAGCSSGSTSEGITLNDVNANPDAYYGHDVIVSGEVDRVVGPHVFTIGGKGFGGALLVISPDPVPAPEGRTGSQPLYRRDVVQVTGTIRPFSRPDFIETYGDTLSTAGLDAYESRPVLVATRSASVVSPILVTPRIRTDDAREVVDDVAQVTGAEHPRALAGAPATFSDVRVQGVLDGDVFWIGDERGDSLLVVVSEVPREEEPAGTERVAPGEVWNLTGTLMEMPTENELKASWTLDAATIQAIEDQPVYLLAALTEPVAGTQAPGA